MSRFKNEVAHLQAHVKTLRLAGAALFVVALLLGFGWWSAPKSLTIHVPPDLRSGSTRKWWDVPPESVYAFTFYIWQQAQRWPTNGEQDYPRNLHALSAYFTPSCRAFLQQDYEFRRSNGELRQRVRGIYEIPGRGYGDEPAMRVRTGGKAPSRITRSSPSAATPSSSSSAASCANASTAVDAGTLARMSRHVSIWRCLAGSRRDSRRDNVPNSALAPSRGLRSTGAFCITSNAANSKSWLRASHSAMSWIHPGWSVPSSNSPTL